MSDYLSPEAVRALCDAFVLRDELESSGEMPDWVPGRAALISEYRRSTRSTVVEADSEPKFASLAGPFINALALYSPNDLGRHWLIHRLYGHLIEGQAFAPGELGVLRADIAVRIEISSLSPNEKQKLTAGFDKILTSVKKRLFAGTHIARNTESHTGR